MSRAGHVGPGRALLIVVLALILIPLPPGVAQEGETPGTTPAPADWVPWFDTDLRVRVPLNITLGPEYPDTWAGDRLVLKALDVTQVLADGGWPVDPVTGRPQGFTVDPDSVRVVPRQADAEPIPHLIWPGTPFEPDGTFDASHQVLTVGFLAPESLDEVFIYFDRTEDGTTDPPERSPTQEQRILQAVAGPGAGHELYGVTRTAGGQVSVLVGAPHSAKFRLERLTSQWSQVTCSSDRVGPGQFATCSFSTGGNIQPIRVLADKPVVAYAYPQDYSGQNHASHAKVMALGGIHGTFDDTTLIAPAPHSNLKIYLMAKGGCAGTCLATLEDAGQQVVLSAGLPTQVTIDGPTRITSEAPILGWIHGKGRGPALLPIATSPDLSVAASAVPRDCDDGCNRPDSWEWGLTATGDRDARMSLIDEGGTMNVTRALRDGRTLLDAHDLGAASWPDPPGDAGRRYTMQTQGSLAWPQLYESHVGETSRQSGVVQLPPTPGGAAGWITPGDGGDGPDRLRIFALPLEGETGMTVAFDGQRLAQRFLDGQRFSADIPLLTQLLAYKEGTRAPGTLPTSGAMAEVFGIGGAKPMIAFTLYQSHPEATSQAPTLAPGPLAGHLHSVATEEEQADILGPLFRLSLDPADVFARPGDTVNLALEGSGFIQNADGTRSPLTVLLRSNTTRASDAPALDLLLDDTRAELAMGESEKITRVQVQLPQEFPDGVLPTSYQVQLSGEPEDGGDVVTTTSSITVRVKRAISLTFAETGTQRESFETDGGTVPDRPTLLLRNLGTGAEPVALSISMPPVEGWDARLLDSRGEEVSELTLPPDAQRELELDIQAPPDGSLILDIVVTAQSRTDASISDSVVAKIVHGVSMDVDTRITPDLISLTRGSQQNVSIELTNHGSPINVQIEPLETEGLVLEANATSLNLGEPGTGLENRSVPLSVAVQPDAPLGAVLVGTVETRIGLGDLEPTRSLISLRARVVPTHDLQVTDRLDLDPGIRQAATVDLLNNGDVDETLSLTLLSAPGGWEVELPPTLQIPQNTSARLQMNLTLPPGAEAGPATIRIQAEPTGAQDPIVVPVGANVRSTAAFDFQLPGGMSLAQGETRTLSLDVENRGNDAGEGTFSFQAEGIEVQANPDSLALGPTETDSVELTLSAVDRGNHSLEVSLEPGVTQTMAVDVGTVELAVELVSMSPSPPQQGERFRALARVTNTGDAVARDVTVTLRNAHGSLATETIGRLAPGQSATLNLATEQLTSLDGLEIAVDPESRYHQEDGTNDVVSVTSQDAPLGPLAALIAFLIAVAIFRRRH